MKSNLETYTAKALVVIGLENGFEIEVDKNGKPKKSKKEIIQEMIDFGIEVDANVEEKEEKVVFSRPLPMSNRQKTRRS